MTEVTLFTYNDYLEYCRDGTEYKLFKNIETQCLYGALRSKRIAVTFLHVILQNIFKTRTQYKTLIMTSGVYELILPFINDCHYLSRARIINYTARRSSQKVLCIQIGYSNWISVEQTTYNVFLLCVFKHLGLHKDIWRMLLPKCKIHLPKLSNRTIITSIERRRLQRIKKTLLQREKKKETYLLSLESDRLSSFLPEIYKNTKKRKKEEKKKINQTYPD